MSAMQSLAEKAPEPPETKKNGRLSRRRRRALWSVAGLALAGLLGTAFGVKFYAAHQPQVYNPGEEIADITHTLDRGAGAVHAPRPTSHSDSLRKIDRALPAGAPEPRFTDVTRQGGLAEFRSFAGNRSSQLPEDMGSGVAWGDFDNDGNDDLFVVSAGGSLDLMVTGYDTLMLFRNDHGVLVRDTRFPNLKGFWTGTSWADYDRDGN